MVTLQGHVDTLQSYKDMWTPYKDMWTLYKVTRTYGHVTRTCGHLTKLQGHVDTLQGHVDTLQGHVDTLQSIIWLNLTPFQLVIICYYYTCHTTLLCLCKRLNFTLINELLFKIVWLVHGSAEGTWSALSANSFKSRLVRVPSAVKCSRTGQ